MDLLPAYIALAVIILFVFCLGTVIGSFLNVVVLRAFSGESIVMPPSKCPKCQNKLKWWHNIPILSYILLKGKCYYCHEKISIQYPIVEFITGILFVLVFFRYGISPDTIIAFAVVSLLLVLSITDIKERVIFDGHAYALVVVGLFYNFLLMLLPALHQAFNTISGFHLTSEWLLFNPLTTSILGIIAGVIIMEVVAFIGRLIAGQRAFGEGDTLIAAALGAVFGWTNVILIIILAVAINAVCILPLFLKNQLKAKHYDTILSFAAVIVYAVIYEFLSLKTSLFSNFIILLGATLLFMIVGIVAIFNVLKRLRNNEESFTVLPFGPALAFAGICILLLNISISL